MLNIKNYCDDKKKKVKKAPEPKLDEYGRGVGEAKRKTARAIARVYPGVGNIYVNKKHYSQYFFHYSDRLDVSLPMLITSTHRLLDAKCVVQNGGQSGQAGAVRLAIAKALVHYDPTLLRFFFKIL